MAMMKRLLLLASVSANIVFAVKTSNDAGSLSWCRPAAFAQLSCTRKRGSNTVRIQGSVWSKTTSCMQLPKRGNFLTMTATDNSSDTELTVEVSEGETERQRPQRRRRRKQQSPVVDQTVEEDDGDNNDLEAQEKKSSTQPFLDLKPRESAAVALEVKDVRAVVGLRLPSQEITLPAQARKEQRQPSLTTPPATFVREESRYDTDNTNSLERLLADARQMKLQQEENDDADDENDQGFSIPSSARSIASTIVTVDFFVVCAFLVWFLVGAFASSFLHNDDIQIAFNSNFERIVQPALGLLMVGAVASAIFKDPEEESEQ